MLLISLNPGLVTPTLIRDKSDPNYYRGVCVSRSLGKLFCSIINTRLKLHPNPNIRPCLHTTYPDWQIHQSKQTLCRFPEGLWFSLTPRSTIESFRNWYRGQNIQHQEPCIEIINVQSKSAINRLSSSLKGEVWGRAVHYHRPASISTFMNWWKSWNNQQHLASHYMTVCRWSGSAVSNRRGSTAEPDHLTQVLCVWESVCVFLTRVCR